MRAACQRKAPRCCSRSDKLVLGIGVQNTGQGHATIYPRLIAAKLGIPAAQISHRHGDTESRPEGQSVGRLALHHDGRQRALSRGRADAGKGKADRGRPARSGRIRHDLRGWKFPRRRHRPARRAVRGRRQSESGGDTLDTKATVDTPQTFPNGCHVAEVEIDPETGMVEIVAYAAVDDAGVVLDHTLVAGQLVGGLAQGIGQALMENAVYDPQRSARHRHVHGLRNAARERHAAGRRSEPQCARDDQSARREGRR